MAVCSGRKANAGAGSAGNARYATIAPTAADAGARYADAVTVAATKETLMSTAAPTPTFSASGWSSGWSLVLGVLLVIAGISALLFPVVAAVAATLYLGWFALIAGGIAIAIAIKTHSEPSFGWRVVVGVVYVVLGFLLVANPVVGAESLALFVGALLAAAGAVEIALAFKSKPHRGWGWLLANGILSLILALMIAIGWPLGSLVLIGYLVGFQIITCGVARIAFGMAARKTAPAASS
jgi:uncharacterized membrane protein HdeD (DUF308 family)